jgi:hypothetical protein
MKGKMIHRLKIAYSAPAGMTHLQHMEGEVVQLIDCLIGLDDSYAIPFIGWTDFFVEGEENASSNWPTVCGLGSQGDPRRGHCCGGAVSRMEAWEGGRRLHAEADIQAIAQRK